MAGLRPKRCLRIEQACNGWIAWVDEQQQWTFITPTSLARFIKNLARLEDHGGPTAGQEVIKEQRT